MWLFGTGNAINGDWRTRLTSTSAHQSFCWSCLSHGRKFSNVRICGAGGDMYWRVRKCQVHPDVYAWRCLCAYGRAAVCVCVPLLHHLSLTWSCLLCPFWETQPPHYRACYCLVLLLPPSPSCWEIHGRMWFLFFTSGVCRDCFDGWPLCHHIYVPFLFRRVGIFMPFSITYEVLLEWCPHFNPSVCVSCLRNSFYLYFRCLQWSEAPFKNGQ